MLKIKDNVDLKELEKFGFEREDLEENDEGQMMYIYEKNIGKTKKDFAFIDIYEVGRTIEIYSDSEYNPPEMNLDTLYDLIKADLVEKVEQ